MKGGKRVAVVVPAYDEERRIAAVIAGIPAWIDRIVVVDDASTDRTSHAARAVVDARVRLVRHETNRGVGASIRTGYSSALDEGYDVLVVMAGDGQMDPADLDALVEPLLEGRADYVKGNRFLHPERRNMPFARRIAGEFLAAATRATTGLVIGDSQCGYTAITASAARRLPLHTLWPRYGYPNDLLAMLAVHELRVVETPVRPVYEGQKSGVRPWHVATVLRILFRRRLEARTRGVTSASFLAPSCASESSSSRR